MPVRASSESQWDARIARARTLASSHPAASDALNFYAALAEHQLSLLIRWAPLETLTVDTVVADIPGFLSWLSRHAHAGLASMVVQMATADRNEWRPLLQSLGSDLELTVFSWSDPRGTVSDHEKSDDSRPDPIERAKVFVAEALLQPFAELSTSRSAGTRHEQNGFPVRCPACGALPVVGVLREEGHGAKRSLTCALCLREREYQRVVCPACGEQQFDALPVYTADRFEHVRIEACDRCHRYIKTIDLTKDGLAVPPVDDIASLSLDLWARERGYVRLRDNILGF